MTKRPSKTIEWLRAHINYDGDGCLIWPFGRRQTGRGQLQFEGKFWSAHRLMCVWVNGPPPTPHHEAAHSCGRGHDACVHPKHLSWKTRSENQQDRYVHNRKPHYRRREMFPTSHGNVLNIWRRVSWKDGKRGSTGVRYHR